MEFNFIQSVLLTSCIKKKKKELPHKLGTTRQMTVNHLNLSFS